MIDAFPILGAGLGWLTLLQLPFLLLPQANPILGLVLWLAGLGALWALVSAIGNGARIPGAQRRQDANLAATLGEAPVRRWLVAHVDTKAQGHSLAGRLVAVWMIILAAGAVSALVVWRLMTGPPPGITVIAAAGLVTTSGLLAGRGRLRGGSPGARDNATGLLAALEAADQRTPGIGFLFPGAEEFGLAGARAWAASSESGSEAEWVNFDTITGRGNLYLLAHDGAGDRLAESLVPLLAATGIPPRSRRLPVGILVDSVALARRGWAACTVAQLDWADLGVIHTPRDSLDGLDPETAVRVGRALARVG